MSGQLDQVPLLPLTAIGLVFLVLAGFLTAIEISLAGLSRAYAEDLVEEGVPRAERLEAILTQRARAVAALHVARVVALTIAIFSGTLVALHWLAPLRLPWWGAGLLILLILTATEFLLVLVLPGMLVSRSYLGVALAGSALTSWLVRVSYLFDPLVGPAGPNLGSPADAATAQRLAVAEDLRELADEVGEAELMDEDDKEMLRSVFEMGQTLVREVMVPRTAMVTIGGEEPLSRALEVSVRSGFSRIPVVADDIDDVIGIVYLKDVVHRLLDSPETGEQPVRSYVREAVFVPETRRVDDEIRAMQANNIHVALVVDEYGGIAGLVTLEDLLEELVGEVVDEHDRAELEPEEISPGTWRVPARYSLNDLEELLQLELDQDEVDSVGGLLGFALDRVPIPGSQATTCGLQLMAEEAVGRRKQVESILVRRADSPSTTVRTDYLGGQSALDAGLGSVRPDDDDEENED